MSTISGRWMALAATTWLTAGIATAALVTINSAETWDGIANPHSGDGVTLTYSGGTNTYTIPDGLTIDAGGRIGLGTANSNVTLSFAPGGGGLTLTGSIHLDSGLRDGTPPRSFTLAMNDNSIAGTGDLIATNTTGANTQNRHALNITGTGSVSFDDINFLHYDGGAGGDVNIAVAGSVTLDTVNASDNSGGGGAAESVTIRASSVTVGAVSAYASRSSSAVSNGNIVIEALAYPGFNPSDAANRMSNTVTLLGPVNTVGSGQDQPGGNITIRGTVVTLGTSFSVGKEADSTLTLEAGVEPPFTGFHFYDSSADGPVYTAAFSVVYGHAVATPRETQKFDSADAADYGGWIAMDGDGTNNVDGGTDLQAGWTNAESASSELAGDQSGEARLQAARGANTKLTYYADLSLNAAYTFSDAFSASGRLDFNAIGVTDLGTGVLVGFFDRNATLSGSAFRNANLLSVGLNVNDFGALCLLVQRSDAAGAVTVGVMSPTTLAASVGNDLLFSFDYDPEAGTNGQGLLSGTITDASALVTTNLAIHLTVAHRTALAGGELNSFGLCKPRAAGTTGLIELRVDDLVYGTPRGPSGTVILLQ